MGGGISSNSNDDDILSNDTPLYSMISFFESLGRSELSAIESAEYCLSLGINNKENFILEVIKDKSILDYLQFNVNEIDNLSKLDVFTSLFNQDLDQYLTNLTVNNNVIDDIDDLNDYNDNNNNTQYDNYNVINNSFSMHNITLNEDTTSIDPTNQSHVNDFNQWHLLDEENEFNLLTNDISNIYIINQFDLDLSSARITFNSEFTTATRNDRLASFYHSTYNPIAKAISKVTHIYSQFNISLDYFPFVQRNLIENTFFSIGFSIFQPHNENHNTNNFTRDNDKGFGLTNNSWGMIFTTNIYSGTSIYHIYENGFLITNISNIHTLNQFDEVSLNFDLNQGKCDILLNQSLMYSFQSLPIYESYITGFTLPNCYKIGLIDRQIDERPQTNISNICTRIEKVIKSDNSNDTYNNKPTKGVNDLDKYCCICLENMKCVVLLPCRHLCVCKYCSDEEKSDGLIECPLCRHKIEQKMTVFL